MLHVVSGAGVCWISELEEPKIRQGGGQGTIRVVEV